MAWRITERDIQGVIETDSTIRLAPFIAAANALTDYVSSKDADSVLTDALLVEVETYLAAYFYAIRDQQYQAKKTGKASAVFQGKTEKGLDANYWGQAAKQLDVSGTLASLGKRQPSMAWLGLPPSDQTDYVDRD